ncbi:KPN_02809 family neutral zinc metallopeptidase [Xylanimonas protaetiae]|uniref:Neutral zinc metallopeptidase n=1 Tax=Xylanimonas protaetiae TaxID=2509457 RepID=A0A4P6F526_9MICO|nr:neutral zinc metallopeptidase [Xylanimonas protaetiae]QAY70792.1 neutral zinc metallopeptidase [Xylanimonas protaetiae]
MTFTEGGKFEGGRVRKGGGGSRRTGAIAGGGIGAILVALLAMFFGNGGSLGVLTNALTGDGGQVQEPQGEGGFVGDCTAAQANTDLECELSATVQSLDAYWQEALPQQAGVQYTLPEVESFDASTSTACGPATADTGPFYCPPDQTIYIDVSFYQELVSRFGSSGGPLAREYVVAHEMGHHIENLVGAMDEAQRGGTGAESDSVRIELQADCYAGMWAAHASTTVDPDTGVVFLNPPTEQDLQDAVSAAQAVGDDHIQAASTGRVNPDLFTHGTSKQRVEWFARGYNGGTLQTCDALHATRL